MELNADGSSLSNQGLLTLSFTAATSIEAGKPYIVKWTTTGTDITNPLFQDVTISSTSPTAVAFSNAKGDDCQFVGQYAPFTIDDDNRELIVLLSSGSKLGYSKNNRTLNTCRAHFLIPTANAARSFELNFDGETTGIGSLIPDLSSKGEGSGCYTLSGCKLNGVPTQKGIYIHGGRKVVIQ